MHTQCETGPTHDAKPERTPRRKKRLAASSARVPQSGEFSVEHVIAAAKRRRAPVSVETAGYIALAVADSLVSTPADVHARHAHITSDGAVNVRGAGRADEPTAERTVRSLLDRLLGVAVGASPALTAAARRVHPLGIDGLVDELEAALIPVNRDAARRAIGRLAREVERSGVPEPPVAARNETPPQRRSPTPRPQSALPAATTAAITPATTAAATTAAATTAPATTAPVIGEPAIAQLSAPMPSLPEPTDPLPGPAEPHLFDVPCTRNEPAIVDDRTEVDTLVAPIEPPPPPPPIPDLVAERTPQLATYDPHTASHVDAAVALVEAPSEAPIEVLDFEGGLEGDFEDDFEEVDEDDCDLLTYEPPEAEGDESLDFGTASPPDVGLPEPEQRLDDPEVPAAPAAEVAPSLESSDLAGPDRVDELLAGFASSPRRSSRQVAGDLKSMLGLPPTPAPPASETLEAMASNAEPEEPKKDEVPPPIEFHRPRNPKFGLIVSTGLLILALAILVTLYVLFPALLVGH